jgi:hypothetical protein
MVDTGHGWPQEAACCSDSLQFILRVVTTTSGGVCILVGHLSAACKCTQQGRHTTGHMFSTVLPARQVVPSAGTLFASCLCYLGTAPLVLLTAMLSRLDRLQPVGLR